MRMSQLVRRASTAGLILALTALPLLNSQSAHGDEIGDLQSRANQIAQQMTDLQNQISAAVNTYLDDPKSLKISAEPTEPVPFPMIMGAAMGAPQTIPQVLGVTVTANE